MRYFVLSAVAAASFGLSAAAHAQQAGHYTGTTSQGQRFEFTLSDDGNGGLALTDISLDVSVTCAVSGNVLTSGIGIGTFLPFSGTQFQNTFSGNTLYEPVTLKFKANGTVGGSVSVSYPAYADVNVNRKTENCASGKLTISAAPDLGESARRAPVAAGVTITPR